MTKQRVRVTKTSHLFTTLLVLCVISVQAATLWKKNEWNEGGVTGTDPGEDLTSKYLEASALERKKRQTADVSIIDSTSRGHTHNRIKLVLMRMLTELDASMGENCRCTFEQISRRTCDCKIGGLLTTLLQLLSGHVSLSKHELRQIINSLEPQVKNAFHKMLIVELTKARRRARWRVQRHLRALRRRHARRRNPFAGKQLLMF